MKAFLWKAWQAMDIANWKNIFWISQLVLFVFLQIQDPESRLSFQPLELFYALPLLIAVLWKKIPLSWRTLFLQYILIHALFVVLHYNIHNGTLSLVSFFSVLGFGGLWGLFELIRFSYQHIRQRESLKALAWSLVSWVLFAFAVPPLPLGPLAIVLLVPWIRILRKEPLGRALFATFWSGVVFNAMSYYWIFNVAKVGPPPAIISGLFLLVSYLSAFHVLAAWVFVRLRDRHWGRFSLVWLAPLAWAGIEVARSYGQISFPWGHLGYAFGNHVELLQGLAYVGVYGYTLFILYANMIVAWTWEGNEKQKLRVAPYFAMGLLWVLGMVQIKYHDYKVATEKPESMRIALVQPSIHQTNKWSKEYFDTVMTKTWSLVKTVNTTNLDLLVLPETAIPDLISLRPMEDQRLRQFVREHKVPILIGALNYDRNAVPPKKYNYYNSAFLYDTLGSRTEYRKIRLVPFSEHLPFDGLFPVVNYVDLGEGDFSPGTELPLFGAEKWTPNICYETIYPDFLRDMVHNGTRILVNITNDGWFGRTTAPGQHANLVRYRAVETGLPVARVANSGISIFYDGVGRSYQATQLYEEKVVYQELPLRNRTTFYSIIGDAFETILVLIMVSLIVLSGIHKKKD